MHTATVIIDSREDKHWRLPFPDHVKVHPQRSRNPVIIKIKKRVDKLDAGDYCLDGYASRCLVETKRSARELAGNNFADLAAVLWQEVLRIEDSRRRQRVVKRIAGAL